MLHVRCQLIASVVKQPDDILEIGGGCYCRGGGGGTINRNETVVLAFGTKAEAIRHHSTFTKEHTPWCLPHG